MAGMTRTINLIDDPGAACLCVSDHVPKAVQLHVHHILPKSWGGSDHPDNEILLCPSTHDNVHRLLREYQKVGGEPDWAIRRHFGAYARDLAARAWDLASAKARLREIHHDH